MKSPQAQGMYSQALQRLHSGTQIFLRQLTSFQKILGKMEYMAWDKKEIVSYGSLGDRLQPHKHQRINSQHDDGASGTADHLMLVGFKRPKNRLVQGGQVHNFTLSVRYGLPRPIFGFNMLTGLKMTRELEEVRSGFPRPFLGSGVSLPPPSNQKEAPVRPSEVLQRIPTALLRISKVSDRPKEDSVFRGPSMVQRFGQTLKGLSVRAREPLTACCTWAAFFF